MSAEHFLFLGVLCLGVGFVYIVKGARNKHNKYLLLQLGMIPAMIGNILTMSSLAASDSYLDNVVFISVLISLCAMGLFLRNIARFILVEEVRHDS